MLTLPILKAAKGLTNPTRPKPDEAGVPPISHKGMVSALIAAVRAAGIAITGRVIKFGIIIFMAPSATAIGTPALLTRAHAHTNIAAQAPTPIPAAAEAIPVKPIAIPIATVDKGLIMIIENEAAINMHINQGCNVVKVLMICPMKNVICDTYGNIFQPTNPIPAPAIIGNSTMVSEPSLLPIARTTATVRAAQIITLMMSPIPASWKSGAVLSATVAAGTNFHAPEPIKVAPATVAI